MAAESEAHSRRWLSLLPTAGCGAFAASTLSLYFRDLAAQAACAGTLVCGGFRADVRSFVAGLVFGILALGLLSTTVIVGRPKPAGVQRRWLAPLLVFVVASSFLGFVVVVSLNNIGAAVYEVVPVAIWAFVGIGFVALWAATTFGTSLVGIWRWPARGLAVLDGSVAIGATLITVVTALLPRPGFL